MLCPAASGRGGAWCGQGLVVVSLAIRVAREVRLGWVSSHSRVPRRLDLGHKLDRAELPLGHSHGVELGLLWVGCHLGRCPFHNTQLGPRHVRRGPLRFWGHQVRCRSPLFASGRTRRAGRSISGAGSPTLPRRARAWKP